MSRMIDETGHTYGRLFVLGRDTDVETATTQAFWKCRCECGNVITVSGDNLRRGHTKSCGCYKNDKQIKHGMCGTAEYQAYQGMIDRCENPNNCEFESYGGRGIRVCDRWRGNFTNFFSDMGLKPHPEYSLDRIDVNGDYSPENCRWTDIFTQARNRTIRKDNKTGVPGAELRFGKYRVRITAYGKIYNLGTFDTIEEAAEARKKAEAYYWGGGDAQ